MEKTENMKGVVDRVLKDKNEGNYSIVGWACQTNQTSEVKIEVFIENPKDKGGVKINSTTSYYPNEEKITKLCGTGQTNRRFKINLSKELVDLYAGKPLYLYANSNTSSSSFELKNSGKIKVPSLFKIALHLGPKLEDISTTSNIKVISDLDKIKKMVDAYYFLIVPAGLSAYWPERPKECSFATNPVQYLDKGEAETTELGGGLKGTTVNIDGKKLNLNANCLTTTLNKEYNLCVQTKSFCAKKENINNEQCLSIKKWNESSIDSQCIKLQEAYYVKNMPDHVKNDSSIKNKTLATAQFLQKQAVKNIALNLNLKSEDKKIIKELVLNNKDFAYDEALSKLTINQLSFSSQSLYEAGVPVDLLMAYHEPTIQLQAQTEMITIPELARDSAGNCINDKACSLAGLSNPILGLLKNAFDEFSIQNPDYKKPLFSTDIRVWSHAELIRFKQDYNNLSAVTFEGGPYNIDTMRNSLKIENVTYPSMTALENFAIGASWLLKNTEKDIYFLMPNSKSYTDVNSKNYSGKRSVLIDDYQTYINDLNKYLKKYGVTNGACHPKIWFTPAGYGSFYHASVLPLREMKTERKADWANSVSGMVGAIDEMRTKLCENK